MIAVPAWRPALAAIGNACAVPAGSAPAATAGSPHFAALPGVLADVGPLCGIMSKHGPLTGPIDFDVRHTF